MSAQDTTGGLRPVAWMRGVRQPSSPNGPEEYDVECCAGEDPPDNNAGWTPLYSHPPTGGLSGAEEMRGRPMTDDRTFDGYSLDELDAVAHYYSVDHEAQERRILLTVFPELLKEVRALRSDRAANKARIGELSPAETAPKDGTPFLAWCVVEPPPPYEDEPHPDGEWRVVWWEARGQFTSDRDMGNEKFTGWTSLPAIKQESGNG